jgi:hypothetical protein
MNEKNQEEWLDRQLHDAVPYIEDDGFTARILRQLPPAKRRDQSLRSIILIGLTALGSALAYVLSDGGRFVVIEMSRLATIPTLWLFAVALGSGILVMTGGLIASISKTTDLQS